MSDNIPVPEENRGIRINKFLASCGIESRRQADKLIKDGRVEVNGTVITAPGMAVTEQDFVKVDGKHVTPLQEVAILLNKPRGYVCSRDPQGAIGTIYDLLPAKLRHLNYVGRLDADSEGLLILTNKGGLIQHLTHPSNGLEKEYWVTTNQAFDGAVLMQFLRGVRIPEGNAKAKYVCRISPRRACIVLTQGLKRQIRQMFECLGYRVGKLVRVRIGGLWGGDLEPGSWRFLTNDDIAVLRNNPLRQRKYLTSKQIAKNAVQKLGIDPMATDTDGNYIFNPKDFEPVDSFIPTPEMTTRFMEEEVPEYPAPSRPQRRVGGSSRRSYNKKPRSFGKPHFKSNRDNTDEYKSARNGEYRPYRPKRTFVPHDQSDEAERTPFRKRSANPHSSHGSYRRSDNQNSQYRPYRPNRPNRSFNRQEQDDSRQDNYSRPRRDFGDNTSRRPYNNNRPYRRPNDTGFSPRRRES